jgi:uncharacterized membrane protein
VDKSELGQIFSEHYSFLCHSFHQLLHIIIIIIIIIIHHPGLEFISNKDHTIVRIAFM